MPFVTVQLGQCGNQVSPSLLLHTESADPNGPTNFCLPAVPYCMLQLGAAWFDTVAQELSSGAYGSLAADTFFHQRHDSSTAASDDRQWAARAVLVDMEPKVCVSVWVWVLLSSSSTKSRAHSSSCCQCQQLVVSLLSFKTWHAESQATSAE